MIFNSAIFLIFFPLVFWLYWFVLNKNLRAQNGFVLLASYVFYGWWDWRFLSLILASTIVDFIAAQRMASAAHSGSKKAWLWLSVIFNLGLLGFFKYFNFFSRELADLMSVAGLGFNTYTLDIILPVGISFYTFQTMSYSLDVYYGKMKPTRDFVQFAAYVSFFPQLVAGPIERAKALLPQFEVSRSFDYNKGMNGLRLILWGLFKKVVIADSLAPLVNEIFAAPGEMSGVSLALGVIFFAFQIYGDFSGYSDIAIGCAKLLGFELMSNFKFPYFSRDIAEFWRRWHVSLSSWFRDYLYIPLGGSRGGMVQTLRNVMIIFVVSGFWHGANWTFIIWGVIHALLFVPLLLLGDNRKHTDTVIGESGFNLRESLGLMLTFVFVCFGWIFFRAESFGHAIQYIGSFDLSYSGEYMIYMAFPIILVVLEWFIRRDERLEKLKLGAWEPWVMSAFFILIILFQDSKVDFIYFQF